MSWQSFATFAVVAAVTMNVIWAVLLAKLTHLLCRRQRELDEDWAKANSAMEEATAAVHLAQTLDVLLASLCRDAYRMQHLPIWDAWAQVMGSIDVKVEMRRGPPPEDSK